ncbi:hypothetical protein FRC09_008105 [Ceratobasidium sp. 395]|nr:hypothetical protein FRC09_008105 [Ceratobasidium sp. 395]
MKSFAPLILVSAISVSAIPRLHLDVVDVHGLNITAVLKNTGDETLKASYLFNRKISLLNDPRTVLSAAPTDTFTISSESGSPAFTGIQLKYVPSQAAALNQDDVFTVLAPGQSINITHDLAGAYNFTLRGEGLYDFNAANVFTYVDASGALKTTEASTTSNQFSIAGKLAAGNDHAPALSRRAVTYTGCSPAQQSQILDAATESNKYVSEANTYLAGISSGTARYTNWFGNFTVSGYNDVLSRYQKIGTDATESRYDCAACITHPKINFNTTYAYVNRRAPETIYLCGVFWRAPVTGTNSRAGTIVHENSHFIVNGGARDHTYGHRCSMQLARSSPTTAIDNADNIEYFAENSPALA